MFSCYKGNLHYIWNTKKKGFMFELNLYAVPQTKLNLKHLKMFIKLIVR